MNEREFLQVLSKHNRVAIVGGPQVGKTTLAKKVTDRPVFHNDDHKDAEWSEVPGRILSQTKDELSYVVEGVHVSRALRKGLEVDAIIHLQQPHVDLTPGQISMHKGQDTIMKEAFAMNPTIPVYR